MITRGTTPTIAFTFSTIPIENIDQAYLTIKQGGKIIIERNQTDMDRGENYISWVLTQEETLLIRADRPCDIQCRYRTDSDFSGASKIYTELGGTILKDGVI